MVARVREVRVGWGSDGIRREWTEVHDTPCEFEREPIAWAQLPDGWLAWRDERQARTWLSSERLGREIEET